MNSFNHYALVGDFATLPLDEIYQKKLNNEFTIDSLLISLQQSNLLCEDEVNYYAQEKFKSMATIELLELIQKRCIHHAQKEREIKASLGENGGFIKLQNGTRIDGSLKIGGLQPNYIIDSSSPTILNFLSELEEFKSFNAFKKMQAFGNYLRTVISRTPYDHPVYLKLMSEFKERNLEIPLSEYLKKGVGTCREMSMLTTLGLCYLGLDANYYYAKVQTSKTGHEPIIEDHALTLVRTPLEVIVVDNYFRVFNFFPLDLALSGVTCKGELMYDNIDNAPVINAKILNSRLYPTARHLSKK